MCTKWFLFVSKISYFSKVERVQVVILCYVSAETEDKLWPEDLNCVLSPTQSTLYLTFEKWGYFSIVSSCKNKGNQLLVEKWRNNERMFEMNFKFLPIEVEGKNKNKENLKNKNTAHCNVCDYFHPRREGYSRCSQWNVLFNWAITWAVW